MHRIGWACIWCAILLGDAWADGDVNGTDLQMQINQKYKNYFGPESQMLLPFKPMELPDWKKLQAQTTLRKIYAEPDKYYNGKVYTLTLYQDPTMGTYYLDAKGGFWGMDELVYGPMLQGEIFAP
jgi:hypothetical protein